LAPCSVVESNIKLSVAVLGLVYVDNPIDFEQGEQLRLAVLTGGKLK
jgi:hypothetical protein